ncbi:TolC family protein [bacterium]|nr:TolC family protein [bacterium]
MSAWTRMRRRLRLVLLIGCAALPSCTATAAAPRRDADSVTPADSAAERLGAAAPAAAALGGDPDLPTAPGEGSPGAEEERLTLSDAIAECLANDPRIRAGVAMLQQARAELSTASLLPNPSLDTGISLFPLGEPFTVDHQGGPPQFDVGIAFPIDWLLFGKRAARIDTARAGVDVAAAELADLVRQRLAATAAAFYDVLEAQALLDLARQDQESLERLQRITETLVRLGGAGTIENDRVRVSLLDSQREARRRAADLAIAKAALLAQIGRSTSARRLDVVGSLEVAAPLPPIATERAFQLAQRYRPDVLAAQRRIAAAAAAARTAESEAFPDVTPRFGYTRQFQSQAIGFPDVNAFGVGVDLSLPVFDRNQGGIAAARAAQAQAESERRATLVELRAEIEQAVRDHRFAYAAVTADAPLRIEAARNARDKIETAYRVGGRPLIDVLDAQRAFRDTQRLDVEDRAQYWQSLHRLNAAVGKEVLR